MDPPPPPPPPSPPPPPPPPPPRRVNNGESASNLSCHQARGSRCGSTSLVFNSFSLFPTTALTIPTCITARASRTFRDAHRDRYIAISVAVGGGESVPGIPGACATRNFTFLVRGSWVVVMNPCAWSTWQPLLCFPWTCSMWLPAPVGHKTVKISNKHLLMKLIFLTIWHKLQEYPWYCSFKRSKCKSHEGWIFNRLL